MKTEIAKEAIKNNPKYKICIWSQIVLSLSVFSLPAKLVKSNGTFATI